MKTLVLLAGFSVAVASIPAQAQPVEVPPTWGGDLASRPRLTGDWGGVRDELGKKGVVFDLDVYWMPQAITGGGKDSGSGAWGNAYATFNLDTQKAGLWPGGFLKIQTVTSFGHSIYGDTGALVPANEAWMLPSSELETGLQGFTFMQFLSHQFGLVAGKINTLDLAQNYFYGDYRTGFLTTGINLPLVSALVPLSAFGGGAIYLPSPEVTLAVMALDPNGKITSNDLGDAFDDGVMALATADVKTKLFGRPNHQNLTLVWSDKERISLVQDPSNLNRMLLNARFPRLGNPGPVLSAIIAHKAPGLLVPVEPLNHEDETWAAIYAFEQYLWQPTGDAKRGIGAFVTAGISDGKANPIRHSYTLGLVGKGVVPGRPGDDFGIGWARTEFSDDFVPFLRNTFDLGLDHEDTLELYYSAAVTPWMTVSPSLQVISSGLDKTLDSSGNFKNLDTTYVAGVRVGIRF
jgi:porin